MTFQWNEFNDIAQYLYSHGQVNKKLSEATYRCAISRCYYAAFHHLRIIGEQERHKKFSNKRSAHMEVIDYFSRHTDKVKQKAGIDLLTLKDSRSQSDYKDQIKISDGDAAFSMALSQKIILTVH